MEDQLIESMAKRAKRAAEAGVMVAISHFAAMLIRDSEEARDYAYLYDINPDNDDWEAWLKPYVSLEKELEEIYEEIEDDWVLDSNQRRKLDLKRKTEAIPEESYLLHD